MSGRTPRETTHALLAAVNAGDGRALASLCTQDFRGLDLSRRRQGFGPEDVRTYVAEWRAAFPDLHVTQLGATSGRTRITSLCLLEGTHEGPFLHIPATRRRITLSGFVHLTCREGRVARALLLWDLAGMLRAMHLLPELPAPSPEALYALLTSLLADTPGEFFEPGRRPPNGHVP